MKIKIVDTNLDVRPNLSPYFIQSIYDYYIGQLKGELLRMEVIDLKVQECLSDSYEFWDYFSENQVWVN